MLLTVLDVSDWFSLEPVASLAGPASKLIGATLLPKNATINNVAHVSDVIGISPAETRS